MRPDWDTNASAFAVNVLTKHLQSLQVEMEGVRIGQDIEYIHRMRVASRRLRNALDIFATCFPGKNVNLWQKEVQKITSSLGEARDKDVQIECVQAILENLSERKYSNGLKRLQLRLKQKRSKLQTRLIKSLDEFGSNGEMISLEAALFNFSPCDPALPIYTKPLYYLAWESILQRLQYFLTYEIFIYDIENVQELHKMRIGAKKLRYSLEIFSPLYPNGLKPYLLAARQTQELLGNFHDCNVWLDELPLFFENEKKKMMDFYGSPRYTHTIEIGVNYFIQNRIEERLKVHQSFLSAWQNWQDENLWLELENTLKAPLFY